MQVGLTARPLVAVELEYEETPKWLAMQMVKGCTTAEVYAFASVIDQAAATSTSSVESAINRGKTGIKIV